MEKIIGIHLDIPRDAVNIIMAALRKTKISFPRNYLYRPHITLYLCRFPARQFPTLVKKIQALSARSFTLRINTINHQKQNNGKIFLSLVFSKPDLVRQLHQRVLSPANTLRGQLIRKKDQQHLKQHILTRTERQYLMNYGSRRVLSLYRPHITLGEVATQSAKQTIRALTPFLRRLKKMPLPLSTLVIGLYDYDNVRQKYTKVIHEDKITLR